MKRFPVFFLLLTLGAVSSLHADDTIRTVQTRLKAGGFYFGELNGRYDSETAAGVTRYQIRNGLQITGKLDAQTRYALGVTETKPTVPTPRLGEDVWRYLRKSDQEAILRLIAENASKQKPIKKPAPPASPPAASVAVPSSPARTSQPTSYSPDRLRDYVAAFVLAGLDPHVGAETEFFADRVDYFGEPAVSREKIRRDLLRYNERWPKRGFWLAGDVQVQPVRDRLKVTFPLRYELRNGSRRAAGKVLKTLVLEKTGRDDLQIVAVNERKAK
jgi:hypothetical protein